MGKVLTLLHSCLLANNLIGGNSLTELLSYNFFHSLPFYKYYLTIIVKLVLVISERNLRFTLTFISSREKKCHTIAAVCGEEGEYWKG